MQWGTPSDLEDFNWYSDVFNKIINKNFNQKNIYEGCLLMTMAGEGSDFKKKDIKFLNHLLKFQVRNVYKSNKDLPRMETIKIVTREELIKNKKTPLIIKIKI